MAETLWELRLVRFSLLTRILQLCFVEISEIFLFKRYFVCVDPLCKCWVPSPPRPPSVHFPGWLTWSLEHLGPPAEQPEWPRVCDGQVSAAGGRKENHSCSFESTHQVVGKLITPPCNLQQFIVQPSKVVVVISKHDCMTLLFSVHIFKQKNIFSILHVVLPTKTEMDMWLKQRVRMTHHVSSRLWRQRLQVKTNSQP